MIVFKRTDPNLLFRLVGNSNKQNRIALLVSYGKSFYILFLFIDF